MQGQFADNRFVRPHRDGYAYDGLNQLRSHAERIPRRTRRRFTTADASAKTSTVWRYHPTVWANRLLAQQQQPAERDGAERNDGLCGRTAHNT